MTLTLSADEPFVTIAVPLRALTPQLVAALAAAATPAPAPTVYETTCEPAPESRPGLAKALPANVVQLRRSA